MYYKNYARIRDSMGVNDAWVAKESGVSPTTLTEWKKTLDGNGYTPKIGKLKAIAEALKVSLAELVEVE